MIEYLQQKEIAIIDGVRFRRDKQTGYYLSGHKIGGRRVRLHIYVWGKVNGAIPKGYHIHHKDHDKSNNELENLELLSQHEHLSHHSSNQTEEHRQKFHAAGIEAAKEWHKSKEGHEWHKAHFEKMRDKLYAEHMEKCAYCGKELTTTATRERCFCCNACKSAFRRKSGVDNIQKECVICGKTFTVSKYSKQQTCSLKCGNELRKSKKRKADRSGQRV